MHNIHTSTALLSCKQCNCCNTKCMILVLSKYHFCQAGSRALYSTTYLLDSMLKDVEQASLFRGGQNELCLVFIQLCLAFLRTCSWHMRRSHLEKAALELGNCNKHWKSLKILRDDPSGPEFWGSIPYRWAAVLPTRSFPTGQPVTCNHAWQPSEAAVQAAHCTNSYSFSSHF